MPFIYRVNLSRTTSANSALIRPASSRVSLAPTGPVAFL
ncbi:hypothetical protein C4K27_0464 [Pseudomonas chlororaphis subsp. chlororaphis]|nr:hypothetical protein C4K27_0464 [Pseudomonas chlororaphis subsp. chlororaphis]